MKSNISCYVHKNHWCEITCPYSLKERLLLVQSGRSDFNASTEILIIASALIFHKTSPQIRSYLALDRFIAIEKVICSTLRCFFVFFKYLFAGQNGNMRKSFTAVARVRYIFSLCVADIACECVCCVNVSGTCAQESRWETKWRERERTASRVPKASTFCYAIARSWRRDSIKRRTRHHGRPINPQTKVDYDFSRGHRSRLLLRPVHTHERAHRFFGATCTLDEFEYRTDRRELLRSAPPVHCEISFPLSVFYFFILTRTKYQWRSFRHWWNINANISHMTFTPFPLGNTSAFTIE